MDRFVACCSLRDAAAFEESTDLVIDSNVPLQPLHLLANMLIFLTMLLNDSESIPSRIRLLQSL